MKHLYVIFSFTLLSTICYSQQEYYPIPEENVYWTVKEFDYDSFLYDDYLYTVEGDTLVNGVEYKKIYKLNDFPTIYDTVSSLHCLMRQDSSQKKVWFVRTYLQESEEKLGYDLSISVGDTVELPAFDFDDFIEPLFVLQEISEIDISYLGEMSGIRKKYFFVNSEEPSLTLDYIEGITEFRSVFPIIDSFYGWDPFHQSYTFCMQQDGIYAYAWEGDNRPPDEYCGFILVDVDKVDVSEHIKISPNPANSYLTFELPQNFSKVKSVYISNLIGQNLQSMEPDAGSRNILLNVSHLTNGLYLLHINMADMVAVKKIIVSH